MISDFKEIFKIRILRNFMSVAILGAMLAMLLIVGSIIPFTPYKFDRYYVLPAQVCSGDAVEVDISRAIEEGPYSLTYLEADAYWSYVDGEGDNDRFDTTYYREDITTSPMQVRPSAVLRVAPSVAGRWQVGSDIIVHGRMFGIVPRTQELTILSVDSTIVTRC